MLDSEIGYIAGLIDGEGSFSIGLGVSGRGRYRAFQPRVRINMTTPEPLWWLQEKVGGSVLGPYPSRNTRSKPHYEWCLSSRKRLIWFCDMIMPYLIVKSKQCDIMRQMCDHPSWAAGSADEHEISRRTILRSEMQALNQRGLDT